MVYHHRGATLNAISNILDWDMPKHPVYLWTLPLFHCNGWSFPWSIGERAGTNVCLRKVDADLILRLIADEKVTHYSAAPIVHNMIANGNEALKKPSNMKYVVMSQVHHRLSLCLPKWKKWVLKSRMYTV